MSSIAFYNNCLQRPWRSCWMSKLIRNGSFLNLTIWWADGCWSPLSVQTKLLPGRLKLEGHFTMKDIFQEKKFCEYDRFIPLTDFKLWQYVHTKAFISIKFDEREACWTSKVQGLNLQCTVCVFLPCLRSFSTATPASSHIAKSSMCIVGFFYRLISLHNVTKMVVYMCPVIGWRPVPHVPISHNSFFNFIGGGTLPFATPL